MKELEWMKGLVVLDRSTELDTEVWFPFALDELLSEQVAESGISLCHIWRHKSAVILGQKDARLPSARAGLDCLQEQHVETCIRHSGGAAVPLDKDVVNLSLIFPLGIGQKESYDDGFKKMVSLLQYTCHDMPYNLVAGEIEGAYCPGSYDLSVNEKKICGIAQRRKLKAYIVQAFINIDGDSVKRAELIKSFYDCASLQLHEATETVAFPQIVPQTLASLSQFGSFVSNPELSSDEEAETLAFIERLKAVIISQADGQLFSLHEAFSLPSSDRIMAQITKLKHRYEVV